MMSHFFSHTILGLCFNKALVRLQYLSLTLLPIIYIAHHFQHYLETCFKHVVFKNIRESKMEECNKNFWMQLYHLNSKSYWTNFSLKIIIKKIKDCIVMLFMDDWQSSFKFLITSRGDYKFQGPTICSFGNHQIYYVKFNKVNEMIQRCWLFYLLLYWNLSGEN